MDTLDDIVERTHNTRYKIEILALRALLLDAQGHTSAADIVLKQAIDLAQVGGFTRVFLDLGVPVQVMLRQIEVQDHSAETISRILAAFPADDVNLVSGVSYPSADDSTLVDPLTPRELEVLTLLRGPLSIKEIAQKLHISHATARRHSINIYGKFGVHRRWDAVAKAEEMDILPQR